jgi:hypothetical protein
VCGKPFPREENCRRHVLKIHRGNGHEEEGMGALDLDVDMDLDEVTRDVRRARKRFKRTED